jgi:hypothetical protein
MTYSGSSVGGHDGGSQHSLASWHSSILGGPQEADVGGYRDYASATSHYEGQHRAVYGSASMSGAQQVFFTPIHGHFRIFFFSNLMKSIP